MAIAFVPVDLPKVPYSEQEYWDMFEKNKSLPEETHVWHFYIMRETEFTDEEQACITGGPASCKYSDKTWWWNDTVKQELPKLIDFIEALPLRKLTHVSLMSNVSLIVPHQDFYLYPWNITGMKKFMKEAKGIEPVFYRIILGGNRTSSFFVSPTDDVDDAVCITLPEETDTFLANATDYYHGAFATGPKKLICFVCGFIDFENHKKLLDKSINRFSDYIIRFSDDHTLLDKPEQICITGFGDGDLGTWPPDLKDSKN